MSDTPQPSQEEQELRENIRKILIDPNRWETWTEGSEDRIIAIILADRAAQHQQLAAELRKALQPPHHPTDNTACSNHERYTSACCGCQRARAVAYKLEECAEAIDKILIKENK